jgi:hypothetical protein
MVMVMVMVFHLTLFCLTPLSSAVAFDVDGGGDGGGDDDDGDDDLFFFELRASIFTVIVYVKISQTIPAKRSKCRIKSNIERRKSQKNL